MDAGYAEVYRSLHERHWWWRARANCILHELRRHSPAGGFGAILDVGCGDGLFFDELRAFGEPQGVEPDTSLLTEAGRSSGLIHTQPFDEDFAPLQRFGLILMLDVIEHLDDDGAALRRAWELMEPGALLLVTVPALQCLWTAHDDFNHHRRRYRRSSLEELLGAAGFEGMRSRYLFHWTAPAKLLVRVKERLMAGKPAMASVPPAPINSVLRLVTDLDTRVGRLLPLPFGSSVIATARKGAG